MLSKKPEIAKCITKGSWTLNYTTMDYTDGAEIRFKMTVQCTVYSVQCTVYSVRELLKHWELYIHRETFQIHFSTLKSWSRKR